MNDGNLLKYLDNFELVIGDAVYTLTVFTPFPTSSSKYVMSGACKT